MAVADLRPRPASNGMKIVVLSGLYPPNNHGGAEKVASLSAKELISLGQTVTVVTTGKKSGLENNVNSRAYILSPRNIFWYGEIGRFPFFIRVIWHLIDLFNFGQARAVKKILEKEKPDLVWTHNLKGLGFLIPLTIKKLGLRHIHTVHDVQLIVPSGLATTRPRLGLYGRLTRYLFASPEMVTSPSAWLLDLYKQHGFFSQSRTVVWPHIFAEAENFPPRNNKNNKFLYLGQLEATKGVPFLMETMGREAKNLIVAGHGSLKDYCATSEVDYRGYLAGDDLERVWREIDFLIVPSLIIENSPTVILEAFSHGVPVIASNIGGIPELVRDGENGFLFAPGDSQSLLAAVTKAQAANYAALSQQALARYQVLRHEHTKALGEILL